MAECKCGRELKPDEKVCPACSSEKNQRGNLIGTIVGGVVIAGGLVLWLLNGKEAQVAESSFTRT